MGSIHAFSLLLEPIENKFFVSRTFSSFTYSLSLISITAAVYFGSYIYKRFSPTRIVLIVMTLSTLGTLISAFSDSIYFVWIGYGLFFGFAKNLGLITDMKFGPDGALYVISLMEGKIYKISS